jgi:hypothetical protein
VPYSSTCAIPLLGSDLVGKLGTPVLFDVGVYFLVFGMALTIIFTLMDSPATAAPPKTGALTLDRGAAAEEREEREVTTWS